MSHPQAPTRQPTPSETDKYAATMHSMAIGALIVSPILALLPPRKLNFTTFSLGGLTVFSGNYLYREKYGRSIWERASQAGGPLPTEKAREYNRQYKLQQEAQLRKEGKSVEESQRAQQGVLEKVWMGDETQGWKERREQEVMEKLKEGKGYGDIIMDQIWDVWNWGKSGDEKSSEQKK